MMTTQSIQTGQYLAERDGGRFQGRAHTPRQHGGAATVIHRWDRLSDDSLIAYCKAGHKPAWEALLSRHRNYIARYARSLCRNRADADDVTAQTLARIYGHLHTFRNESCFAAWVTRITYNVYRDTQVRSRPLHTLSLDTGHEHRYGDSTITGYDLADPRPTPEAHTLDRAAVESIVRDIAHLPGYLRQSLQLHLHGYSYEQMASAMGVAVGTVKSRLSRARSMLRERLESAAQPL